MVDIAIKDASGIEKLLATPVQGAGNIAYGEYSLDISSM